MEKKYDLKKGFSAIAIVYAIWGSQPLFFSLDKGIDTWFLLAGRIFWAAAACLLILRIQGRTGEVFAIFRDRDPAVCVSHAGNLLQSDPRRSPDKRETFHVYVYLGRGHHLYSV